jgi:co-chaperonin GroES (HSP10)
MNLQSVNIRVLVRLIEEQTEETLVTTGVRLRSNKGVVVSKGKDVSSEIEVGDTVYFNPLIGSEIIMSGEKHVTLKEIDIDGLISFEESHD